MSPLTLERVRTLEALDDLAPSWRALEEAGSGDPTVFQSWHWNRTWCDEVLGEIGGAGPDVHVLTDGRGDVRAILPLFRQAFGGRVLTLVQFLGHRMSYHNDVLMADPNEAPAIADLVLGSLESRTILHLRSLNDGAAFTRALDAAGALRRQTLRVVIPNDASMPDPAQRLGKAQWRKYRSRRNALLRAHDCRFEVGRNGTLEEAFEAFVELHCRRFEEMGRETLVGGANLRFLRKAVLAGAPSDTFEVLQLLADDKPIASVFAAVSGGRYFNINMGFDPTFSKYAPLKIALAESMRRAFEEHGCAFYDFGPGYEPFKFDWKPETIPSYYCAVGGRDPLTRLATNVYRRLFERSLPSVEPNR